MAITITVTSNRLAEMGAKLPGAVSQIVKKSAFDLEAKAKALAPVDTGNMKSTIRTDITDGGMSATVSVGAEYGAHVEYGTQPHVIRPRNGKYLAFPGSGGGTVFATEVNHPGTRAQPFMTPAAEHVRPSFIAAFRSLERML